MNATVTTLRILVRVFGLILIVLGIIFWTGHALGLIRIHMIVGLLLAVCLWVLAFLAARAHIGDSFAALVAVWAVLMVLFGVTQARLMPGSAHWVIQVLHLLVGLVALGLGDKLGMRLSRAAYQAR